MTDPLHGIYVVVEPGRRPVRQKVKAALMTDTQGVVTTAPLLKVDPGTQVEIWRHGVLYAWLVGNDKGIAVDPMTLIEGGAT